MQTENTPRKSSLARLAGFTFGLLGALLCTPFGFAVSLWLPLAPLPRSFGDVTLSFALLGFLLPVIGLFLMVIGLFFASVKVVKKQRYGWWILVGWLVYTGFWWGSIRLLRRPETWRRPGLMRIAQNAQPLIAAIEQYKKKTGVYPPSLAALTPNFINQIPYTGAPGYPEFKYRIASANTRFQFYELHVDTPNGFVNFDYFFYWPEKNYPPRLGDPVERMGDWAYLHE